MRNHDRATLRALFIELRGAVIAYDKSEEKAEIIGGFLDKATIDYRDEANGHLLVKWWFGRVFFVKSRKSRTIGLFLIARQFALSSKYAILLFQHVASLANLDRISSKTFTIPELRALLGVPAGKLDRFSNLNTWALKPAIAEINQLSRMNLTVTPKKPGARLQRWR